MNNKLVILPAVSALMLFLAIGLASACSCINYETTPDKLNNAKYVFTGRISNIHITGLDYNEMQEVTVQVIQYWKPSSFPESVNLKIYAPIDTGANCGHNFDEGKEYLIYAYLDEETGKISTNSCMGSTLLEQAKNEINGLNEINPVQNQEESNIFVKFFSWIRNIFY